MAETSTEERDRLIIAAMKQKPVIAAYIAGIIGNFDAAEDVFQETIVVVCNKWQDFDPSRNLRAWCLGIARRQALKWIRSQRRYVPVLDEEALSAFVADSTWQEHEGPGVFRFELLRKCLDKLTEKARTMILLRYGESLNCTEIARRFERPVNSVYVTLTRIRAKLRKCIRQQRAMEGI